MPSVFSGSHSWIIPAVLAAVLYLPALGNGFVYDDHPQIAENPYLRMAIDWPRVFLTDVWSLTASLGRSNYYRPMLFTSYAAISEVAGFSPWAFHLISLLMHALVTMVVWRLLLTAGLPHPGPFVGALLFALHPVHVEAVAWAAALTDIGATLFVLIALLLYWHWGESWRTGLLTAASFLMALLWKEIAIVVPALALAMEHHRGWATGYRRRLAILLLTAGAYLGLRWIAVGGIAPIEHPENSAASALLMLEPLGHYMKMLVWPAPLTVAHPAHTGAWVPVVTGLLVLAASGAGLRLWPKLNLWIIWTVASVAPLLWVTRIRIPVAERSAYLASVGVCALAAWFLVSQTARIRWTALIVACGVSAGLVLARIPDWKNDEALYRSVLRVDPESTTMRVNLAGVLVRDGRLSEARQELDLVLRGNPRHVAALESLASVEVRTRNWERVRTICAEVAAIDPRSETCHIHNAMAAFESGNPDEARRSVEFAVQSNALAWQATFYLGTIEARIGRFEAAASAFQRSIEARPTSAAYTNLGNTLERLNRTGEAEQAYRQALQLDPAFRPALQNLERYRR